MSSDKYPKETAKVHKHFEIEKSESVITHFACAHKGRILKQGRLYITQNYLCFYAQIVGKVHKKTIKLTEVAEVAKANYGVFPNAIKVTTRKKKEIVFASFLMREQAYDAIRKEWLNLRQKKSKPSQGDVDIQEKEEEKRGASPVPRRGSIEPSSGSESESDKKKKKRRWSLSKKDKKRDSGSSSDQSAYSDTEVNRSDVSGDEAKRRHSITGDTTTRRNSTSSASSNERSNGANTSPSSATSTTAARSPSSYTSLSATPSAPSTPSSTPPSRGDRAQALIKSGAISTGEPAPTPSTTAHATHRQSIGQLDDATPTEPVPPISLWQRLRVCYCCF